MSVGSVYVSRTVSPCVTGGPSVSVTVRSSSATLCTVRDEPVTVNALLSGTCAPSNSSSYVNVRTGPSTTALSSNGAFASGIPLHRMVRTVPASLLLSFSYTVPMCASATNRCGSSKNPWALLPYSWPSSRMSIQPKRRPRSTS